jgi:hypothetical protein
VLTEGSFFALNAAEPVSLTVESDELHVVRCVLPVECTAIKPWAWAHMLRVCFQCDEPAARWTRDDERRDWCVPRDRR